MKAGEQKVRFSEKQSCGAVLFSAAPAPAPGQFQKAIKKKLKET